jgi:DNA-binding NarL/FixJ family response regulator
MVKILLADPQDIIFHGLLHIVADDPSFQITSRVKERSELFAQLVAEIPDILIIDDSAIREFSVKDCRHLVNSYSKLKIFFLTEEYDRSKSLEMIQTGAHAYLTKNCSRMEILYALQMVRDGQKFFCSTVLDTLTRTQQDQSEDTAQPPQFSVRELQIMEFIAQDLSTQEIAARLALSPHTIHAHRKKILKKLGASSPIGLIKRALHLNILQLREGNIVLNNAFTGEEHNA